MMHVALLEQVHGRTDKQTHLLVRVPRAFGHLANVQLTPNVHALQKYIPRVKAGKGFDFAKYRRGIEEQRAAGANDTRHAGLGRRQQTRRGLQHKCTNTNQFSKRIRANRKTASHTREPPIWKDASGKMGRTTPKMPLQKATIQHRNGTAKVGAARLLDLAGEVDPLVILERARKVCHLPAIHLVPQAALHLLQVGRTRDGTEAYGDASGG